jgi:hypothetical protein
LTFFFLNVLLTSCYLELEFSLVVKLLEKLSDNSQSEIFATDHTTLYLLLKAWTTLEKDVIKCHCSCWSFVACSKLFIFGEIKIILVIFVHDLKVPFASVVNL